MRKVLLASSALVAAAGVSAASADVNISIFNEFGFASMSDNTTVDADSMYHDGEMTFAFSETSDSGLTYSAHVEMEVNDTQSGIDESSISLSTAEMGSITLGSNDDVSSSFATYLPGGRNMASGDDWVQGAHNANGNPMSSTTETSVDTGLLSSATGASYSDSNKAAYRSPNFGGLSFGISYQVGASEEAQNGSTDTGDNADTVMGVRYATEVAGASVSIQGFASDNGEDGADKSTKDAYGVSIAMGDISVAASILSSKDGTAASGTDVDTTGYGAGYQVNDQMSVAVNVVSSEDDTSKDTLDTTVLSLSYTIAPGLNFAVAMNSYDYKDSSDANQNMDSDEIRASIQANF